ncbi:hypothetical protein MTR_4g078260 [Medicago truncatula]|uniref:Uncharacterized protein n=1 Tax=Medicago truncatula TaxID=3880 RepID=G7JTT0_MEDTR|nr:hypothetical protein MTR_4g078260 [Medicago truncatula]
MSGTKRDYLTPLCSELGSVLNMKVVAFSLSFPTHGRGPQTDKHSSSYDDGDAADDSNKEHYPSFAMPKKMTNFKWVLRARFDTKDEFNEAITNYAINNRTCLKRFKN